MSTDIRASVSIAALATSSVKPETSLQNPLFALGGDSAFPRMLAEQTRTRSEPPAAPERDEASPRTEPEAASRPASGKDLPARDTPPRDPPSRAAGDTPAHDSRCTDKKTDGDAEAEPVSAEATASPVKKTEETETAAEENEAALATALVPPVVVPAAPAPVTTESTEAPAAVALSLSVTTSNEVETAAPEISGVTDAVPSLAVATDAPDQTDAAAATGQPPSDSQAAEAVLANRLPLLPENTAISSEAVAAPPATTLPAATPAPLPVVTENALPLAEAVASTVPPPVTPARPRPLPAATEPPAMTATETTAESVVPDTVQGQEQMATARDAATRTPTPRTGGEALLFKEQLTALAQQMVSSDSASAAAGSAKKSDSVTDVKSFSFARNLDQLSTARTNTGKTLSTGIQTPLGSREWAGELGQRLVMMVSSKLKSAEIHLNPKDLGPVEVRIRMHEDKAHVVFTSQVVQTREALEQAVPRLREMLDQNGVALGNVNVQDQGAQYSRQQQGQTAGTRQEPGTDTDDSRVATTIVRREQGLVDYYA